MYSIIKKHFCNFGHNSCFERFYLLLGADRISFEDKVWIGDKAAILPGVTIGEGPVIGASAIVTKDIPPFCIAGGNPVKITKQL